MSRTQRDIQNKGNTAGLDEHLDQLKIFTSNQSVFLEAINS